MITQREGIKIAAAACDAVMPAKIYNFWRHSGIVLDSLAMPSTSPPPPNTDDFSAADAALYLANSSIYLMFYEVLASFRVEFPAEPELTDTD